MSAKKRPVARAGKKAARRGGASKPVRAVAKPAHSAASPARSASKAVRAAAKPARAQSAPIAILDRGRPRSDAARLRRVARAALRHGGRLDMPVSLLLTDDTEIAAIHEQFLDDATPTDVISFELDGGAEIVVSVETAARCAKARGHTTKDEVALYVVHGLLHVCGFDDIAAKDRARMREAERCVLAALRIRVDDVDA